MITNESIEEIAVKDFRDAFRSWMAGQKVEPATPEKPSRLDCELAFRIRERGLVFQVRRT